jgi:two-component system, sensor histidine kinase
LPDPSVERVLILAPTGRDAPLIERVLGEREFRTHVCRDIDDLFARMGEGAGAVLVAEEALSPHGIERLVQFIDAQPTWSDLPLLLVTLADDRRADALFTALGPGANLRILRRPLSAAVLVAAVRSAVRERRRQYEVRSLLAELEVADRRKGDFIGMLGHELRNPLAAIRTAVQLLQRRAPDPATERMSSVIDRQVDTIARVIEDLLEVTRLARGKMSLERRTIDLRAVVADYLRTVRLRSDTRSRRISSRLPTEPLMAEVDPVRFEQIVGNLVTNALKYTPPPGAVHLTLERDGDTAVLCVEDEGIGLEPNQLATIFEAFTQVESARELSQGGLGLGLPLVRSLVEMHGGTVTARSDGPGKGSVFEVRLPLHAKASGSGAG